MLGVTFIHYCRLNFHFEGVCVRCLPIISGIPVIMYLHNQQFGMATCSTYKYTLIPGIGSGVGQRVGGPAWVVEVVKV